MTLSAGRSPQTAISTNDPASTIPNDFDDDDSSYGTGESFGNGRESFSDDHHGEDDQSKNNEQAIAKSESRAVQVVRALVVVMLLAVTGGVGYGVFYYVSSGEESAFDEDFEDSSEKVMDSIGDYLDQTLGAVDNFVVGIVTNAEQASESENPNTTWPYARIPDFAVRGAKLLSLSKASVFGVYPRVTAEQRRQWEEWAVANDDWVDDSMNIQRNDPTYKGKNVDSWYPGTSISNNFGPAPENATGPHYPTYYQSPLVPVYAAYGWDLYNDYKQEIDEATSRGVVTMGRTLNIVPDDFAVGWIEGLIGPDLNPREPLLAFYYPIDAYSNKQVKILSGQRSLNSDHKFVGVVAVTIFWRQLLRNILSKGSDGTIAVIGSDCNQTFTYEINGASAVYVGAGDLSDPRYHHKEKFAYLHELNSYDSFDRSYTGFPLSKDFCPYWIKVYPSDDMKAAHESNNPIIFMLVAISIFIFTSMVFILYDCVSERRQRKVLRVAKQSTKIVAGLFPQVVRDRLFKTEEDTKQEKADRMVNAKFRLQQFLRGDGDGNGVAPSASETAKSSSIAPIAELFSETTVLFADIAGFTAWSSLREPAQVFSLLEALYGAFDQIAHARGVFKVETIGDSYVAVAGLPDPRPDHAIVMCKFARDIRERMVAVTKELGTELGPDTAELGIRIGLNSGPVTAGVLRGDRSRFQLFGDTVNTAARMESTGMVSKIQVTELTANYLKIYRKDHWLTKREGGVVAKGKGQVQTFFVEPRVRAGSSSNTSDDQMIARSSAEEKQEHKKTAQLVEWNCAILTKILKQIIACREAVLNTSSSHSGRHNLNVSSSHSRRQNAKTSKNTTSIVSKPQKPEGVIVLDEVREVIDLPEFNASHARNQKDPSTIELNSDVLDQLKDYVQRIANLYRANKFHCFEHASHVTMSVVKLLARIQAPTDEEVQNAREDKTDMASTVHDQCCDPLIQFSCVFAALIHDVDHQGVPNTQLFVENSPLVGAYNAKSMAEQNSVDIAWGLLMEHDFDDLRSAICATSLEMTRFRQLVVNSVMATDIMDGDLKTARNARWEKAFSEGRTSGESELVNTNRRATIVIEHMLQASDVSHTMQHWHVFCKWNERLFNEMYEAFTVGRAEKNPAEFWYMGEIEFFDHYIIPLAKKLNDCGVFGVSSDEYLSYALKNREEWERRGKEVVASMLQKIHKAQGDAEAKALASFSKSSRSLNGQHGSTQTATIVATTPPHDS
eukprot:CAMPEP_0168810014 /NCGR_PEP_ID=MMETSP0726-20121227/3381_1 /TAXON_ID=265536 /ORGANISM="Amphiprora sp., Strain CCMP467" /LENGTH=1234 /DNA_ID=CAMNT_0008862013 /DNA_START=54 /DNA_END=3758 /DNA_ORIENTATION=+